MSTPRALAFLFLAQVALAQQPTPLLPEPKLTPGDVFDVTAPGHLRSRLREEGVSRSGLAQKKGVRPSTE
jgi:hypothetical protein